MVVIGAGNTAIDAAIASVRLGATDVHIVYRRGPEQMSAFAFEYEHARLEGVKFVWHAQPTRILGGEAVEAVELTGPLRLEVDLLVLAIGQATKPACRRGFNLTAAASLSTVPPAKPHIPSFSPAATAPTAAAK